MSEYLAENSRLRQLSRRYSDGQLAFGEYRAARRELLGALESGQVQTGAAPLFDVPAPEVAAEALPREFPDDEAVFLKTMPPHIPDAEAPVGAAPVAALPWDGHTRILAVVLGVSLLLALGALFYVFAL